MEMQFDLMKPNVRSTGLSANLKGGSRMVAGFRNSEILRAAQSGVVENRSPAISGRYGRRVVEEALVHFDGIYSQARVADCGGLVASGGGEQVGSTLTMVERHARARDP
ncbi:MAG: hypothetical protein OXC26_07100 [Albidovulum sp.]|nr:hypothetical protein [Albidovulum sp.]